MKRRIASTAAVVLALGTAVFAGSAAQDAASKEYRRSIISRAKVRLPTDVSTADIRTGPAWPGGFATGATINCDHVDKKVGGLSPKFICRTADGDELKVKYGGTNGEVYAEVAASRLLWALGFGADGMYSVRVICRGCPERLGGIVRTNGERIFDPAAVERKMPGRELADRWNWDELNGIDEAAGGATVAERDALTLLAVMLQHTDSKGEQQRIVCAQEGGEGGGCAVPLMMINDLGLTFGRANTFNLQPRGSANLAEWTKVPVWADRQRCVGNLSGSLTGTLKNPVISEAGRRLLGELLMQLSDQQLKDVFEAARMHLRPRAPENGRSGFATADEWVAAFKQKRAEIIERSCAA